MKESKDTDPGQEKKTQAGKDTQNSGKSTAQDDGSTAGPPVIWNRKMPEDVVLPASYDYREQGRAPKIGNQGSLYVHAQSFSSGAGRRGRIHHVHGLSSFLGRTGVGVRGSLW